MGVSEPGRLAQALEMKVIYEKYFGVNRASRTPEQWRALVKVYGMTTVCSLEGMTVDEVGVEMRKTFTQNLRQQLKAKHV